MIQKNIIIFSILTGVFLFLRCGSNDEEKAFNKSIDLEKIEAQIILGITENKSNDELLNLALQLNHESNELIRGKKKGIITNNAIEAEELFFGSYKEYWSLKREAYKEIIINMNRRNDFINQNYDLKDESKENSDLETNVTEQSPEIVCDSLFEIEKSIYKAIDENDTKKALELTQTLYHPSGERWNSKSDILKAYTYNEWWNARKESILHEITELQNAGKLPEVNVEQDEKSIISLNEKYLGLYVNELEEGTQLFKFSKDLDTNELTILFQENLSGDLIIKNYLLVAFEEYTGGAKLRNIDDSNDIIYVYFIENKNTENEYKLVDTSGESFEFVSE